MTLTEKTETFEIFDGVGDLRELIWPPELLFWPPKLKFWFIWCPGELAIGDGVNPGVSAL